MSTGNNNNFYSGGRFDPEFLRRMKRIVSKHGVGGLGTQKTAGSESRATQKTAGSERRPTQRPIPPTYRIGDYRRESVTEMKPAGERAAVAKGEVLGSGGGAW